ncbi:L-asparaginase [Clostridium acetobutylicum]|uniref:L-asparaginase n=1 Tax=Clostridium acetobutylicum (strain ATCC 824 / DSM 792 / JCM 1419 / IAM 19013 / LMG 5710 / NBRC 13948 / NRRL B-527 / VKM B-1787 / 2291 / W) TaxID=272562 RepID=Q97ID4_CLOAB|nr:MULTISPECIES: asparaginase [Clostridium]AAK79680.1 L-asparaginase [Clostridium acetobutylicum ATCC 824]ADZ20764.1 L-asparaginase [Clostridium acetobutylicum EA 2018]AEI33592.1 L-asparaginase [Clostridium acetobutylicum DSM 1731]AWV79885.1 asparaginase [Clostridium acetobutylicum]MBC2394131.1 asparaginase [Clostridium acetobutylicum]
MKKVAVIFNGGTISMKFDSRVKAAVPALSGEEIMSMVTGIEKFAEIESFNFSEEPGPHMTPEKMMELSNFIKDILKRDDIVGAVVTHGTDSLEETAYFLDLTIKNEKPVVVTGSMRNSSELGYDGPANLSAAICTAISEESRNKGVLVCFSDELNSASEVTKVHSMHLNAFESPDFGPLGIVDTNKPIFYRDKVYNDYIETSSVESKVALIKTAVGMNSDFIDFAVEKGYKGIVIEAMGRGNVPPYMVEGIERALKKNVPVVLVSRCYKGRVLDSYGYHGGGKELRNIGVIFGDNLPGQKARIKLMLALGKTKDLEKIRNIFEEDFYRIYK